jgi:hypothetical protein
VVAAPGRRIVLVLVLLATSAGIIALPGAAANLPISTASLTVATRTYGAAQTCTVNPSADSYVARELASSNFGTATSLQVSPDALATRRMFLTFDLTGCSPAIPSDALVQSASVSLTVSALAAATRTYHLRASSASWVETSITWSNQPAVSSTVTGSTSVTVGTVAGTVISWTATSDVQSFVAGASINRGWRIGDGSEGGVGSPLLFGSREASSGKPQLMITYLP